MEKHKQHADFLKEQMKEKRQRQASEKQSAKNQNNVNSIFF